MPASFSSSAAWRIASAQKSRRRLRIYCATTKPLSANIRYKLRTDIPVSPAIHSGRNISSRILSSINVTTFWNWRSRRGWTDSRWWSTGRSRHTIACSAASLSVSESAGLFMLSCNRRWLSCTMGKSASSLSAQTGFWWGKYCSSRVRGKSNEICLEDSCQ